MIHTWEVDAAAATFQAPWTSAPSSADTGDYLGWDFQSNPIADANAASNHPATFPVDVPCDDDFIVWVRGLDDDDADSFFASVDGQPSPPSITDLDCTGGDPGGQNGGYVWARLNQRNGNTCDTSQANAWIQTWTAGMHRIRFFPRESRALSRIIITNDPSYTP